MVEPADGPWVDRHGDVWSLGADGLLWTPETAPFTREHVEKKWGPLLVVRRCPCGPTRTEEHPRRSGVIRCANCKEWLFDAARVALT